MYKVLLNGATGKMGQMISEIIQSNPQYNLELSVLRSLEDKAEGEFDLIIDFSSPESAQEMYHLALEKKAAFFCGTTGLSETFLNTLRQECRIPLFYATNASLGVYYFGKLVQQAAELYKSYQVAMHEIHHLQKKDAPSGTAKTLAGLINFPTEEITSAREGEVKGTHEVSFSTPYETITLCHQANDRKLFAESAVIEAAWLVQQKPGFYTINDYAKML